MVQCHDERPEARAPILEQPPLGQRCSSIEDTQLHPAVAFRQELARGRGHREACRGRSGVRRARRLSSATALGGAPTIASPTMDASTAGTSEEFAFTVLDPERRRP
jgi:hypothetical protein